MYENEINKLLNMMGLDFNAIASQMLEVVIENIKEKNPNISASDIVSFQNMAYKNMDIESLRNQYVIIYNNHYSREEIAGLIAFYESSLGRKSPLVNSQISQESDAVYQAYFESLSKEVIEELAAEDS
jgi:hypothetical protein